MKKNKNPANGAKFHPTVPKAVQDFRNSNLRKYLQTAILVVGSQPTYEDLKPWSGEEVCGWHHRSQPTYEDLKPSSTGGQVILQEQFAAYLRGFETIKTGRLEGHKYQSSQPTYEDLKHAKTEAV